MSPRPPTASVLDAAHNRQWVWLTENLQPDHITGHDLNWAVYDGGYSSKPDIRLVAANYLAVSRLPLNVVDQGAIVAWLKDEPCEEVCYLLSAALYKRGNLDPFVAEVYAEGCDDEALGATIRKFKNAAQNPQ